MDALGYVGYFAELLDEWAQEADADDRLYRLGASMLDALAAGAPVEPLARYFEYWLLRLQGVYPESRGTLSAGALAFLAASRSVRAASRGRRARRTARAEGAGERASRAHYDASGEDVEVRPGPARPAPPRLDATNRVTLPGSHPQALGVLGLARVPAAAAARPRGRRRHLASRDAVPRARAEALERRLRAAVAAARRRPLRAEPEPPVQAPPVPGDPQAVARRGAAASISTASRRAASTRGSTTSASRRTTGSRRRSAPGASAGR